jgi:putative Holliday junction resolvase
VGVRVLGIDYGARRIGLAVSDHTRSLARPWQTIAAGSSPQTSAEAVAALLSRASADEQSGADGVEEVVVGLPRRLNGEDTDQTQTARAFATALGTLTGFSIHLQDERLTSREAESRLAQREKDWRRRKQQLDAAAAAVILQDYLDRG